MPHSWPDCTSFTSSLKRFSVDSLPSCTTTLSRIRRTLAPRRRQQTGHRLLHVIHQIVDDVVVADFDAVALGGGRGLLVGADVEADDGGVEAFRQRDVGFADAAAPR